MVIVFKDISNEIRLFEYKPNNPIKRIHPPPQKKQKTKQNIETVLHKIRFRI